jgi:hypothetical protein
MRRPQLYQRIRQILESARTSVARSVNTTQVVAYWLIGREIVEEEQKGQKRAGYGEQLLAELSGRLTGEFGKGVSVRNLEHCRNFYIEYPRLLEGKISHAVRSNSDPDAAGPIRHALRSKSWKPGKLHPNLSWTHYRTLLRIDKAEAWAFYEVAEIRRELKMLSKGDLKS